MKTLVRALLVAAALVSAAPAVAGPKDGSTKDRFSALEFPVSVTTVDQGSFTGTLAIHRFAVEAGALVAVATLTGTATDEAGLVSASATTLTIPLSTVTLPVLSCDSLTLTLAPADRDLNGLILHWDSLTISVSSTSPGDDALLRNLMCQAAKFHAQNKPNQTAHFLTRILQLVV